jgi:hypothetical protein
MCSPQTALMGRSQTALPGTITTLVLMLAVGTTGCAAVGGIFKAGLWVGLMMALLLIVVVFFLLRRLSR